MSRRSATAVDDVVGLDAVLDCVVYQQVFGAPDREVGGMLIGRTSQTGSLPLVTSAIEAHHASENRADLTFTQETWEHVHRRLDERGAGDERIVGWYHSHPGFGIFLSEHDLFVHRNFFSDPSQIAVVVDPIARTEGVFCWRDGNVVKLFERPTPRGWHAVAAPVQGGGDRRRGDRSWPFLVHLAALLVGAVAGLALQAIAFTDSQPARPAPRATKSVSPSATPTSQATSREGTP